MGAEVPNQLQPNVHEAAGAAAAHAAMRSAVQTQVAIERLALLLQQQQEQQQQQQQPQLFC